jgi:hypothetical protein
VSGSAEKHVIQLSSIPSEEAFGVPDAERKIKTLTGHGWRLWFEPEPDGSVTGLLLALESQEVLKSAIGEDFHDAWLELGIDTTLPSEEVRRQRQKRAES